MTNFSEIIKVIITIFINVTFSLSLVRLGIISVVLMGMTRKKFWSLYFFFEIELDISRFSFCFVGYRKTFEIFLKFDGTKPNWTEKGRNHSKHRIPLHWSWRHRDSLLGRVDSVVNSTKRHIVNLFCQIVNFGHDS